MIGNDATNTFALMRITTTLGYATILATEEVFGLCHGYLTRFQNNWQFI
jgi:hypothetical protein